MCSGQGKESNCILSPGALFFPHLSNSYTNYCLSGHSEHGADFTYGDFFYLTIQILYPGPKVYENVIYRTENFNSVSGVSLFLINSRLSQMHDLCILLCQFDGSAMFVESLSYKFTKLEWHLRYQYYNCICMPKYFPFCELPLTHLCNRLACQNCSTEIWILSPFSQCPIFGDVVTSSVAAN